MSFELSRIVSVVIFRFQLSNNMASVKNFIIHTTDARYKSLLTRLLNQGDYKRYYDGHEHTTRNVAVALTNPPKCDRGQSNRDY